MQFKIQTCIVQGSTIFRVSEKEKKEKGRKEIGEKEEKEKKDSTLGNSNTYTVQTEKKEKPWEKGEKSAERKGGEIGGEEKRWRPLFLEKAGK